MPSSFYLGRIFDLTSGKLSKDKVLYDPADLTTHAVVTGMTGSGKTGLCIGLMEEAALEQIPALIIDPKGDLTNLLLHFPELLPSDFKPWLDAEMVRRQGKTIEEAICRNRQFMEKRAGRMGNHTRPHPGFEGIRQLHRIHTRVGCRQAGEHPFVFRSTHGPLGGE